MAGYSIYGLQIENTQLCGHTPRSAYQFSNKAISSLEVVNFTENSSSRIRKIELHVE